MKTKELKTKAESGKRKAEPIPADVGDLRRVPHGSLVLSPTNPPREDVEDLLESIRSQGIIQPLIVRLRPKYELKEPDLVSKSWRVVKAVNGGSEIVMEFPLDGESNPEQEARDYFTALPKGEYEIVAGERRWRAAGKLQLAEVPVLVRALTDKEALELQLIENLQREDLTPVQEAEGYQRMIDSQLYGEGWTESVKAIAQKLGKSPSHVSGRLTLLKLGAAARSALSGGKLDTTIAMLIASIPGEEKQQEALERIQSGELTFKQAKGLIENGYRRSLGNVLFDLADAELCPEAGACVKCPKRIAPNVCTDLACLQHKEDAHRESQLAGYREKGLAVLTAAEAKKVFSGPYLIHFGHDYVFATSECEYDRKQRTWKQLAKLVKVPLVASCDGNGKVVELFAKTPLLEALYGNKILKKPKQPASRTMSLAEARGEAPETEEGRLARQVEHAVAVQTERRAALAYIAHVEDGHGDKHERQFLLWLLSVTIDGSDMPVQEVIMRRGLDRTESRSCFDDLSVAQLRGLLVELHVAGYGGLQSGDGLHDEQPVNGNALETLAEFWPKQVDRKALEKAVRAEVKDQFRLPKEGEEIAVPLTLVEHCMGLNSCGCADGKIKGVIEWRGRHWACHGGGSSGMTGGIQADLILLVPREEYQGACGTKAEMNRDRDETKEAMTLMGVVVSHQGKEWVQSQPEVVLHRDDMTRGEVNELLEMAHAGKVSKKSDNLKCQCGQEYESASEALTHLRGCKGEKAAKKGNKK